MKAPKSQCVFVRASLIVDLYLTLRLILFILIRHFLMDQTWLSNTCENDLGSGCVFEFVNECVGFFFCGAWVHTFLFHERVRVCVCMCASSSLIASLSNPGFICWSLRWEWHQDVSHLAGQPKPLYFHCHWNPFRGVEIYLDSYLCSPVRNHIAELVYLFHPLDRVRVKEP